MPSHGADAAFENNDLEFGVQKTGQTRCPFNAHIRRVYPRSDVQGGNENAEDRRILRAGIAFDQSGKADDDVGLLFVCYQSSIVDKFEFIQRDWANKDSIDFVPKYDTTLEGHMPDHPGIDLIIGQGKSRGADWTTDEQTPRTLTKVPEFVTATGGGYFFSPSISALRAMAA